jgi:hypothetical protein
MNYLLLLSSLINITLRVFKLSYQYFVLEFLLIKNNKIIIKGFNTLILLY